MKRILRLAYPVVLAGVFLATTLKAQGGNTVSIATPNGVNLAAEYFSPAKPGPGILLLSMCDPTTDRSEWRETAVQLQGKGFHVLTFDYQGFGASDGKKPAMTGSLDDAMAFWRTTWMKDVEATYQFLISRVGVNSEVIGVGGASCGVFMGMELALGHPSVRAFVSLGGPVDKIQEEGLAKRENLPLLILSANEGPSFEWSETLFSSSLHPDTRFSKYKYVAHGTGLFKYVPRVRDQIADWFEATLK